MPPLVRVVQVKRDSAMMRYVPTVKRFLEGCIYSFKGILAHQKMMSAFWIGNLKNKTLDGKEVRWFVECHGVLWWMLVPECGTVNPQVASQIYEQMSDEEGGDDDDSS